MNTDRSNVEVVYSGRSGCMCGCRGKYTTPTESAVGHRSANDSTVTRLYNAVMNDPNKILVESANCYYVEDQHTGRVRSVYFKKS